MDALGVARPGHDGRGHVAHREHAVRDDARESHAARERLVLVQRVLIAACVRVGPHIGGGDDASTLRQVLADVDLRDRPHAGPRSTIWERAVHTSAPSASNSSITTVRNPLAPFVRTLSMRARTDNVSPSRSGRSKR